MHRLISGNPIYIAILLFFGLIGLACSETAPDPIDIASAVSGVATPTDGLSLTATAVKSERDSLVAAATKAAAEPTATAAATISPPITPIPTAVIPKAPTPVPTVAATLAPTAIGKPTVASEATVPVPTKSPTPTVVPVLSKLSAQPQKSPIFTVTEAVNPDCANTNGG